MTEAQEVKAAGKRVWPADRVERWPIARLKAYERNPRMHSDRQVRQIAAAIKEWGWTMPLLVDEAGLILAGHGRLLAAFTLGLGEVPVIVARGWSDAQKRAYVVADNKLAEGSHWDRELWLGELGDLVGEGFDLGLVGLGEEELAGLGGGNTGGGEEMKEAGSEVADEFMISLRGPLKHQEQVLQALEVAKGLDGVSVELGGARRRTKRRR